MSMKTQPIGASPLVSTRLAYGCWRLAGTWEPSEVTAEGRAHGRRAVIAAYEAGYTLFDHADIYCDGVCESIFGEAMREVPAMRDEVLIATKCGIILPGRPAAGAASPAGPHRFDSSPEHITWACEQSLRRLGVQTIDLYQLHRPDLLMDPPLVADAFDRLKRAGKVREFGVSNFDPSFVAALQKACPMPLAVNQVEVHLGRLDCFHDGTLDQCLVQNITPLVWSPLGGGFLGTGGTLPPDHPRRPVLTKLLELMDRLAAERDVTRTVLALAWLLKHPSRMIPIVGSTTPERIREAVRADAVDLGREDWYRLLVAARGEPLP